MDDRTITFVLNSLAETARVAEEELKGIATRRFFLRELEKSMRESGQRVFIIAGLRGTGKTTALYQLLKEGGGIAYLSCDELFSRAIGMEDAVEALDHIKKEKVGMGKKFTLLLDEITYLPGWDLKLKVLRDHRPNLTIIATSSSVLPLKKTNELARRAVEVKAFPLSFREYLLLKYGIEIGEGLSARIRKKIGKESLEPEYFEVLSKIGDYRIFALFEEYMKNDLPAAFRLGETAYAEAIDRIVKRAVYEDFSKYANFEAKMLAAAERVVKYLSTVPADGVKIATVAEVAGISKESASKLLETLELAMIIKGVECSGRGRMYKKPKKWFFCSSSLRYHLALPVADLSTLTGNMREDSVFRHLSSAFRAVFYSHEADFIADGMKIEVGKGKKEREGVIIFGMEEKIAKGRVPIPLALLGME